MSKMLRQFAKEYLNFTRKERIGIISVFVLIVFFLMLPFLYAYFKAEQKDDPKLFKKEIESLNIQQQNDSAGNYTNRNFDENNYQNYYQPSEKNYYSKQPRGELFYFDPNTLSADGWKKLGIKDKTVNTIHNYLSKGGRFNKPEDIAKIWGLRDDEVKRLLPYVQIVPKPVTDYKTAEPVTTVKSYERKKNTIVAIDINEADTAALIALPGIGSKLANRIITFRDKLGGFYKIEQVAETYALPDSTFQKIKERLIIKNAEVKKLDINNASIEELKIHPYIRYNIANAIVQYRIQHGLFSSVSDIKKIAIITDDIFNKTAPYLTIR